MKKILFIINSLGGGGAEKALIEFLRHIDYTRYEVSLCLVFHEGCYLSDVPPEVRVFWLYERERNFVHRKSLKIYRNHGIRTLLRLRARRKIRGRYDAIVSFLEGDALLFHDMVRDRAERNVAWLHCDLRLFHWTRKTFRSDRDEELAYGRMDTIVFCSHITQESFERMYRIDVPKTVIYNIIDGDSIRRQADAAVVPHDGFTITAVGSLSEVKSHDRLVRVARMFKDAGYRLRFQIVGAGGAAQTIARRTGIAGFRPFSGVPEASLSLHEGVRRLCQHVEIGGGFAGDLRSDDVGRSYRRHPHECVGGVPRRRPLRHRHRPLRRGDFRRIAPHGRRRNPARALPRTGFQANRTLLGRTDHAPIRSVVVTRAEQHSLN